MIASPSMIFMQKAYHFLGGLTFALTLIFVTAVTAAYGSFVDGIYESPFFKVLLGGFFVNILFSALRRYPFKKRHGPFLVTHLGLLLIITALFVKSLWGLQGTVPLDLGVPAKWAYMPEKLSVEIQTHAGETFVHDIHKSFIIKTLRIVPHAETSLRFWHNGQTATVLGIGTIPFFDKMEDTEALKAGPWRIYALNEEVELPAHTIAIYKDSLVVEKKRYSINPKEAPLYIFEEGWGGYGTKIEAGDLELFGPLFIETKEHPSKGERALVCEVSGKRYTLQEGTAPLPVGDYLMRLVPTSLELPFSLELKKTWMEGDVPQALVQMESQEMHLTPLQGASFQGYHFYLSFWDKEHLSLVISKDPLNKVLLYMGIAFVALGSILLLGRRTWDS